MAILDSRRIDRHQSVVANLVIVTLCSITNYGCDYAIKGIQTVEIQVSDAVTNRVVSNARVTCAPMDREGPTTANALPVKEYIERYGSETTTTGRDGRALMSIGIHTMRGGLGVWLGLVQLKLEDHVTGERYFFRIENAADEVLVSRMIDDTHVSGEHYRIAVISVGPPMRIREEAERIKAR